MCGFVGIFGDIDSIAPSVEKAMRQWLRTIKHRGPDESSYIESNSYVIGFNRLSINNLALGKQPREFKNLVVVFNGEFFNYLEIAKKYFPEINRESLDEVGVLARIFSLKGRECFSLINGQFSVAIYDKEKNMVYLARDPFGIRPLYYSFDKRDRSLIFGSSLEIVTCAKDRALDVEQLKRVHLTWATSNHRTIWKHCYQVSPGSCIEFSVHNERINESSHTFWSWANLIESSKNIISLKNVSEECEEFRKQLRASIMRQSMSDVGYASYLSGGIDSSVIAYELSQLDSPITTFSIAFEDHQYDESINQRLVSDAIRSNHHQLLISDDEIYKSFYDAVLFAEQPLFRSAPIPLMLLSKKVHEYGHKVVFTGEGSDEMLMGYDIFRESKIKEFIKAKPESKLRYKLFDNLYQYLPQFKNKRYRQLAINTLLTDQNWGQMEFIGSRLTNNWATNTYFQDTNIGRDEMLEMLSTEMPSSSKNWSSLKLLQFFEIENLLQGYLLSVQGDRMSMSNSVESRYPFLDLEFVKYCFLSLPETMKLYGTSYKHILRKSYEHVLPSQIINAPKIAYQAPEARIFFKNGKDRGLLKRFLDKSNLAFEIYRFSEIELLFQRLRKCSLDGSRGSYRDNMAAMLFMSISVLLEAK